MSRTDLGMPTVRPAHGHGHLTLDEPFPDSARTQLGNAQMRKNIRHATHTIRAKRGRVVQELPDWQQLRAAGSALKLYCLLCRPRSSSCRTIRRRCRHSPMRSPK